MGIRRRLILLSTVLALTLAVPPTAFTDAATSVPTDADEGLKVTFLGGGIVSAAGEETAILPSATVYVDAPMAGGLRFAGSAFLSAAPGTTVEQQTYSFKGLGLEGRLYRMWERTQLSLMGGYTSRFGGDVQAMQEDFPRWGVGFGVGSAQGARLLVHYGRDGVVSRSFGWGQWMVEGLLPMGSPTVQLYLDCSLGVTQEGTNVYRFGIVSDLGALADWLKR